jgi:beta-barrel assembly-enhancing protease
MPFARWSTLVLVIIVFLGTGPLRADDPPPKSDDPPPKPKAMAKAKPKIKAPGKSASKRGQLVDEPPPCEHMISARTQATTARPPQTMEDSFSRMMEQMANNPDGGFSEVMKDQERTALSEIVLSPAEERRIGRKAHDEFLRRAKLQGSPVVTDPAQLKYLRDLVANLAMHMKNRARYPSLDVTILDVAISDGQSFPGGFFVFTTALLNEPDEATVAGVVAHELAHLDRGHLFEYAKREKLGETAFNPDSPSGMPRPDQFMSRGMALGSLMMNPFRPEHEHEADCVATTWLYLEGYSPLGLTGFLERLNRRNRDQPDLPFFRIARSHPSSLDRRDAVLERLSQLQHWKARNDLKLYPDNLKQLAPKPPGR